MAEFYTKPYLYYSDYLLLIFGLIFFSLAILIYIFSKQSNNTIKKNLKFYIAFLFATGLSVWSELIIHTFPNRYILQTIDSIFHIVAFLLLLEFGRRMFLYSKKWIFILIYILFMFFSDFLINFLLKDITVVHELHLIKHFFEWSIIIIVTWVFFIRKVVNMFINDPIEMQLRSIKIRLIKVLTVIFIILIVIGYYVLLTIGEISFNKDREELLGIVKLAVLGIDGDLHQQLQDNKHNLQDPLFQEVLIKLREVKEYSTDISEIYTMYIKKNQLAFGVDGNIEAGDIDNNLGDFYEGTTLMYAVISQGKAMVETEIDSDQWGDWLSAYAPIKNKAGDTVALLGIDIHVEQVLDHIKNYRLLAIIFLFLAYLLIIVLAYLYYINKKELIWHLYHSKILSSIGDIVGVFDESRKLIYVNDAALKLVGGSTKINTANLSLQDLLIKKDYYNLNQILNNLKEDKIEFAEFTLKNVRGDLIPFYASISYLAFIQGEPLYVFTAMNISAQKMREEDIKTNFKNFLSLFATVIDAKDNYTALHSANVAKYAKVIAKELDLNEEEILEIETAALVHDIGKVRIPDSILKKSDKLTPEEWQEMKRHSEYGKLILENAGATFKHLIPYVYYHHERYDGTGYPTGMVKPPVLYSIIAVADAFEAMTSDRSYRKALPFENAKDELIKYSGTQFHPEVVKAFLNAINNITDSNNIM